MLTAMRARSLPLLLVVLAACHEPTPPADPFVDEREPCSDNNPQRNVYFGDLHVHTSFSFDAYVNEVRVDPFAAYDFARGAAVELPSDQPGVAQTVQLSRPLDFAAVTDHGEYLGEVQACLDPDSPAYGSELCTGLREGDVGVMVQWGLGLGAQMPIRPPARWAVSSAASVMPTTGTDRSSRRAGSAVS